MFGICLSYFPDIFTIFIIVLSYRLSYVYHMFIICLSVVYQLFIIRSSYAYHMFIILAPYHIKTIVLPYVYLFITIVSYNYSLVAILLPTSHASGAKLLGVIL